MKATPVELAGSLAGFRYDEDVKGPAAPPFEVLAPESAAGASETGTRVLLRKPFGG